MSLKITVSQNIVTQCVVSTMSEYSTVSLLLHGIIILVTQVFTDVLLYLIYAEKNTKKWKTGSEN